MGMAHLQFITHYAGESILLCTMRIRLYLVPRPFRARPANTQEAALAAIRLLFSPHSCLPTDTCLKPASVACWRFGRNKKMPQTLTPMHYYVSLPHDLE